MDAVRAHAPTDWSANANAASDARGIPRSALAAAAGDADLGEHLATLAERDELVEFLGQTDDAIALAQADDTFGAALDPLLGRIRDALVELPTATLSRVERDAVESTLQALAAHLGEVAGPDPTPGTGEVPGGGLQAHEDAGGHLIERHVGKSEQWLVDRVNRDRISAASSFRDLPEAEHFVSATIAEHQSAIDAWVDGAGGKRLVVDATFDASTGISVKRGDTRAEDVFSVKLVLERTNALDIGYRIVTGYPSAP